MRVADDEVYNGEAEAAIAHVLSAEREARDAVAQARVDSERIVDRARMDARAVDARTERRVRAVIAAFERELAERLAEIDAAAAQVVHPHPFSDDERAALQRLVRAVAEELVAAPP
jgi:vacuolar-type H+-ATPase subunit H